LRVRTAKGLTTGAEKTEKVLSGKLSSRSIVSGIENKLCIRRLRNKCTRKRPPLEVFTGP